MNSKKENFINLKNERPEISDFSLQPSATKPIDMKRIIGTPPKEKTEDTTIDDQSKHEGD